MKGNWVKGTNIPSGTLVGLNKSCSTDMSQVLSERVAISCFLGSSIMDVDEFILEVIAEIYNC